MTTPNTPMTERHEWDDDACCIKCGFDGAEWSHWKKNTYEGKASDAKQPLCQGGTMTEADCIEANMANLRWKQSGGPERDNQARAVKLELQWSEAARLGGRL